MNWLTFHFLTPTNNAKTWELFNPLKNKIALQFKNNFRVKIFLYLKWYFDINILERKCRAFGKALMRARLMLKMSHVIFPVRKLFEVYTTAQNVSFHLWTPCFASELMKDAKLNK